MPQPPPGRCKLPNPDIFSGTLSSTTSTSCYQRGHVLGAEWVATFRGALPNKATSRDRGPPFAHVHTSTWSLCQHRRRSPGLLSPSFAHDTPS